MLVSDDRDITGCEAYERALRSIILPLEREVERSSVRCLLAFQISWLSHVLTTCPSVNGHPSERLPNTLSVQFKGIRANDLLARIQTRVAASAGSACHSGSERVSSVLQAMGIPSVDAIATVRFSTGRWNSVEEIDAAAALIVSEVNKLRGVV